MYSSQAMKVSTIGRELISQRVYTVVQDNFFAPKQNLFWPFLSRCIRQEHKQKINQVFDLKCFCCICALLPLNGDTKNARVRLNRNSRTAKTTAAATTTATTTATTSASNRCQVSSDQSYSSNLIHELRRAKGQFYVAES